jgi:dUTP pyrophosphatase
MTIFFKRLTPDAIAPTQQTDGAAGFDLHALTDVTLYPGERSLVKTGIAVQIPKGYVGMVCSRSGLALKHGVFVLNAPGIVDSDYRGDVGVILMNMGGYEYTVLSGDRIAQLVIAPIGKSVVMEVSELDDTQRGAGGFGSTGIAQQPLVPKTPDFIINGVHNHDVGIDFENV